MESARYTANHFHITHSPEERNYYRSHICFWKAHLTMLEEGGMQYDDSVHHQFLHCNVTHTGRFDVAAYTIDRLILLHLP